MLSITADTFDASKLKCSSCKRKFKSIDTTPVSVKFLYSNSDFIWTIPSINVKYIMSPGDSTDPDYLTLDYNCEQTNILDKIALLFLETNAEIDTSTYVNINKLLSSINLDQIENIYDLSGEKFSTQLPKAFTGSLTLKIAELFVSKDSIKYIFDIVDLRITDIPFEFPEECVI